MINEKNTIVNKLNNNEEIKQENIDLRQSIDGIIENDDCIEDFYFSHHFFNVRKVQCYIKKEKKSHEFNFLIHNDFSIPLVLDESEISSLKTEQLLKILKPKIEQYFSDKDTSIKSTFMQNLSTYAESIGYEATLGYLMPLVKALIFEKNDVINGFLTGIDKMVQYLLNNEGYNIIMQQIVSVIIEFLKTKKDDNIIQQSYKALISLTELAKEEDRALYILPSLIILANNNESVESQLLSIKLFNDIAKIVGPLFCESYIVPQIGAFFEDSNEKIRMCVIQNINHICESVSYECFSNRIISFYNIISRDHHWPIRKAACENLPLFAKISKDILKNEKLISFYMKYSKDEEEKIKSCAVGIFGEFIANYSEDILKKNENLLTFYINEIIHLYDYNNNNNTYNINFPSIYKSAFSFPSVILSYKKEKWDILKPIYLKFVNDKNIKVKKTISNSFTEISKIIGSENSERDLSPIIHKYFNNNGFEIKNAIINILPDYLKTIKNKDIKNSFIEYFITAFNKSKKWRYKFSLVKVIGRLKDVYDVNVIYDKIVPLLIASCLTTVAKVRIRASKEISNLFGQILLNGGDLMQRVIDIMLSFATCAHYHYRQLFIYMCYSIIEENEQLFMKLFYEKFLELAYDKIENVNITLSKVIAKKAKKVEWILKSDKMKAIIIILKNSKSEIVRNYLKDINVESDIKENNEIDEKYKNVNSKYINKLEIINQYFGIVAYCLGNDKWINKNEENKK